MRITLLTMQEQEKRLVGNDVTLQNVDGEQRRAAIQIQEIDQEHDIGSIHEENQWAEYDWKHGNIAGAN